LPTKESPLRKAATDAAEPLAQAGLPTLLHLLHTPLAKEQLPKMVETTEASEPPVSAGLPTLLHHLHHLHPPVAKEQIPKMVESTTTEAAEALSAEGHQQRKAPVGLELHALPGQLWRDQAAQMQQEEEDEEMQLSCPTAWPCPWAQPLMPVLLVPIVAEAATCGDCGQEAGSCCCQRGAPAPAQAEAPFVDLPSEQIDVLATIEAAGSSEEVLQVACEFLPALGSSEVVSALHLVAKYLEAEAGGPLPTAFSPSAAAPSGILRDERFWALLSHLRASGCEGLEPRSIMQAFWALGKVSAYGADMMSIVAQLAQAATSQLHVFSSQELSMCLWGIARLSPAREAYSGDCGPCSTVAFALAIIRESTPRVASFNAQCLANCLYAMAKLELYGCDVDAFSVACVGQIRSRKMLQEISPQGMANSLWAVAKLRLRPQETVPFCVDLAKKASSTPGMVRDFHAQELSMSLWALARVIGSGRSQNNRAGGLPREVETFAADVAQEGLRRLSDFSPQGLSNVAWALATMDLLHCEHARNFLLSAAKLSAQQLIDFPPQAIANIGCALRRLSNAEEVMVPFCAASIREAETRAHEFSWQDLSGIVTNMMYLGHTRFVADARSFAAKVVTQAADCCNCICTQALLNIALSAVRLKVDPAILSRMERGIAVVFQTRHASLNDIDKRQWGQVQRYCEKADNHRGGRPSAPPSVSTGRRPDFRAAPPASRARGL
jgi:hypothetical protein